MPTLTIYQKPTCSTCRDVLGRLRDAGIDVDAIDYIIEPPSRATLVGLIAAMGIVPRDLLRTREPAYRELGLDDPTVDDERIIDAMAAHPSLIQRPIIVYGDRAVLARPAGRLGAVLREWGLGPHPDPAP